MGVSVLNFIMLDRIDQAEALLKSMVAVDEDSTITQLATAWVYMFLVGFDVASGSSSWFAVPLRECAVGRR